MGTTERIPTFDTGFLELTGKSDSGNVGPRFGVGHGSFIRGVIPEYERG